MNTAFARRDEEGITSAASLPIPQRGAGPVTFDNFWSRWKPNLERWEVQVLHRLLELAALPAGWDGYDGLPMRLDTGMFACSVLARALRPTTPPPQIVPTSEGGLQLEWHERSIDLELTIDAPYKCRLFYVDRSKRDQQPIEEDVSIDFSKFERLLTDLANRR